MKPRVSIIIPLFNDADHVEAAIESCLAQSVREIEVIAVDDASSDGTAQLVEELQKRDARVRLIRQEENQTAFQARRVGVLAARAPRVLFLDGDDELEREAAAESLAQADANDADVVAFGCTVVKPDGTSGGGFERAMQPQHDVLMGDDIVLNLFPVGSTAQGQLWRYLFDRQLLTGAYDSLPPDLQLPRANDLPLAFLALARARKLVSTPSKLYRYFFKRGGSGHTVASEEQFAFMSSAIDSIEAIRRAVELESSRRHDPQSFRDTYESARLSIVGRVLDYAYQIPDSTLRESSIEALIAKTGADDVVMAAADYCKQALPILTELFRVPDLQGRSPRHVVIRATNLGTGGAQGVVVAQARHLAQAGFRVTIAIESSIESDFVLPPGVQVHRLVGDTFSSRLRAFAVFCEDTAADVVVDHYVFYNERWPFFALIAANRNIPTIGWLHNFALRPIVDGSTRLSFLDRHMQILSTVVVLSLSDVAYWKLRGFPNVVYLPNPPSPLLDDLAPRTEARTAPDEVVELIWWGRLQQSTKQVREIIEIAAVLDEMRVASRIKIIGPDGPDLKQTDLADLARSRGLSEHVELVGPLRGSELLEATASAHIFVSTSIIEGYPLALVEAQAMGLPIVMYELPWLATTDGNEGMIQVPQGDRRAAAVEIAALAGNSEEYRRRSSASSIAAMRATSHDYDELYANLVRGRLRSEESDAPGAAETRLLFHQNVLFLERLINRERRAIARAREDYNRARRGLARANEALEESKNENIALRAQIEQMTQITSRKVSVKPLKTAAPSVARTGFRRFLGRLLPASTHQVSFFARHNYDVSLKQHDQLLRNQSTLNDQLAAIQALLQTSIDEGKRSR
ncbi:glycosyltransferase [Microbacterium oleivorans]|uniref:glycosyltransferase n=1 Tax=Microbacterium oleivorans TaxID=273677 RepID=UPI00203B6590|nr:glycosyltransferase [Microbacterium oleivorans]MCM3697089.1 glycosyltransferase [Microbacterium oleivorans]